MNWLRVHEFIQRPLVAVEDHVYHISELLRAIQRTRREMLGCLTIVCLDRAGPDTDAAAHEWLESYPELQVAARISNTKSLADVSERVLQLEDAVFTDQNVYCRLIAGLIRNRGLLLQDIELETLEFIPRERWWETTMLASTVRGIVGERAPRCAFISNKRGYEATFGAELLAAGHDPRDVLNKYETERIVIPFLSDHLLTKFPWQLDWRDPSQSSERTTQFLNPEESEQQEVNDELDLVLWNASDQAIALGGKALDPERKSPVNLQADGNEYQTWQQLMESHLNSNDGVDVQDAGQRVAPPGALRAEVTNAAARHIHSLRKRLKNSQDIVTTQGKYQLANGLSVGVVSQS